MDGVRISKILLQEDVKFIFIITEKSKDEPFLNVSFLNSFSRI